MRDIMPETKKQFEDRLRADGRWDQFVGEREALKAQGVRGQDAWRRLRPRYGLLPADGAGAREAQAPDEWATTAAITYQTLALAARARRATKQQELDWVQQNMILPLDQIDLKSVPSAGAVALLKWTREEGGASDFFTSLFKSQLPSRKDLDAQAQMQDDGRECIRLIEKLQRLRAEGKARV